MKFFLRGKSEKRCFVKIVSWIGPRWLWRGTIFSLMLCLAVHPATEFLRSAAAQGKAPSPVSAHLAAGEFGPARAAADALPPAERDQALSAIAWAQFKAGAK